MAGVPVRPVDSDQVLHDAHLEVAGLHHHTAAGIPLGSSYFGLYRRDTLDRVMRECLVTLDKYTHADLPGCQPRFQRFLIDHGLARRAYVPPKLLNLAYTHLELPIAYHESPYLHHIGGYSMNTYQATVSAAPPTEAPANAVEVLDHSDHRPHMSRELDVCRRLTRSFAEIDRTGQPPAGIAFGPELESRVQIIERLYAPR